MKTERTLLKKGTVFNSDAPVLPQRRNHLGFRPLRTQLLEPTQYILEEILMGAFFINKALAEFAV